MVEPKKNSPGGEEDRPGTGKKAVLLRLSPKLWNELAAWSEDEFRSVNGQIEYLLTQAVHQHRQRQKPEK